MRGGYQEKVKNSKIYKKTFSRVTFLGTSKDPSQKAGKLIYIFSERTYPNLAKLAMVHGLVSNRLSFCIAALHASQFYSCSDQSLVFTNLEAVQVGGHLDSDRSTKVDRIWTVGSFQSCQWSTVIPGAWPWHATGSFHFKALSDPALARSTRRNQRDFCLVLGSDLELRDWVLTIQSAMSPSSAGIFLR